MTHSATAQGGTGIFQGIQPLPPLAGYVASTPKDRAEVLLDTPAGDPLLAVWQYGLGRSMAWTSDLGGRWNGQLVRRSDFPRLAAQLVGWLLPPPGSPRLLLEAQAGGDRLVLAARAQEDTGHPAGGLRIAGQVLGGEGTARPVTLREVMPGSYAVAIDDMPPGAYQIQLAAARADGQPFATVDGGAVVEQTGEYTNQAGDRALLDSLARITGGRTNIMPQAVYDPTRVYAGAAPDISLPLLWLALALLPAEVAVRRLWFGDTTQRK